MREVHNKDWMLNNIPDKSVDVIMADPPYFEVKGEFDFIWSSFEDYLKDVEKWAIECKRVLKDNGSLFWWGHAKKIAYAQIIFDKYFNLENSLVWRKPDSMQYQYYSPDLARSFNTHNERCLFYSNEINEIELKGEAGKCFFNPIVEKLKKERASKTNKELSNISGIKQSTIDHFFRRDANGWAMPTQEHLDLMGFNLKENSLRQEYEELRKEYEKLRRPFYNALKLEDVITQSQQSSVSRLYKHDTQKSLNLIKNLLEVTTRKDSTVLIPFGGSGTDVEACIDLNLNYICYEIEEKHYETIKKREKECLKQPLLF